VSTFQLNYNPKIYRRRAQSAVKLQSINQSINQSCVESTDLVVSRSIIKSCLNEIVLLSQTLVMLKLWMAWRSGYSTAETNLSCIKTELNCCVITGSPWNKCDISRKSPEVPVVWYQSSVCLKWWGRRGHLNWTRRWIRWQWAGNVRVGKTRRLAARSAAAPTERAEDDRYEVSIIVVQTAVEACAMARDVFGYRMFKTKAKATTFCPLAVLEVEDSRRGPDPWRWHGVEVPGFVWHCRTTWVVSRRSSVTTWSERKVQRNSTAENPTWWSLSQMVRQPSTTGLLCSRVLAASQFTKNLVKRFSGSDGKSNHDLI